jgi:hypothetical protein
LASWGSCIIEAVVGCVLGPAMLPWPGGLGGRGMLCIVHQRVPEFRPRLARLVRDAAVPWDLPRTLVRWCHFGPRLSMCWGGAGSAARARGGPVIRALWRGLRLVWGKGALTGLGTLRLPSAEYEFVLSAITRLARPPIFGAVRWKIPRFNIITYNNISKS